MCFVIFLIRKLGGGKKMRKKILIVYDAMITGGTTTAIIPLMKIISKYYDVDLLLNRNNGECMDLIPKEIN